MSTHADIWVVDDDEAIRFMQELIVGIAAEAGAERKG